MVNRERVNFKGFTITRQQMEILEEAGMTNCSPDVAIGFLMARLDEERAGDAALHANRPKETGIAVFENIFHGRLENTLDGLLENCRREAAVKCQKAAEASCPDYLALARASGIAKAFQADYGRY